MIFDIYKMEWDAQEDSPMINYDDPRTSVPWQDEESEDFDRYVGVIDGIVPVEAFEIVMWTFDGRGASWDALHGAGNMGLWSERVFFSIAKYARGGFNCLPAKVDNQPFCIPVQANPLDCFDRDRAKFKVFPHDPTRVMMISKFAFDNKSVSDPLAFSIPESRSILVTSGVKREIESLDPLLLGIRFTRLYTVDV